MMDIDTLIDYIARILNPNVSSPTEWTWASLQARVSHRLFTQAINTMLDMGWVEYHGDPRSIAGTLILTDFGAALLARRDAGLTQ
jgi:hypothetical protein